MSKNKSNFHFKRIAAGTAKFLVQVEVHRGEPANEGADILADKAILESGGRQGVVPKDESSRFQEPAAKLRKSNLSRLSFNIQ